MACTIKMNNLGMFSSQNNSLYDYTIVQTNKDVFLGHITQAGELIFQTIEFVCLFSNNLIKYALNIF